MTKLAKLSRLVIREIAASNLGWDTDYPKALSFLVLLQAESALLISNKPRPFLYNSSKFTDATYHRRQFILYVVTVRITQLELTAQSV